MRISKWKRKDELRIIHHIRMKGSFFWLCITSSYNQCVDYELLVHRLIVHYLPNDHSERWGFAVCHVVVQREGAFLVLVVLSKDYALNFILFVRVWKVSFPLDNLANCSDKAEHMEVGFSAVYDVLQKDLSWYEWQFSFYILWTRSTYPSHKKDGIFLRGISSQVTSHFLIEGP